MPPYTVILSTAANKVFTRLDPLMRKRIGVALDALRDEPRPHGAKKLVGRAEYWRVRVGSYRVVYTIEDERLVVLVLKLGHRRSVYRDR